MYKYFVSRVSIGNGNHEVHKEDCCFIPFPELRIDLGVHENGKSAVEKAKIFYEQINGCYYCSEESYNG